MTVFQLLTLFGLGAGVCAVLVPLLARLAPRLSLLDLPRGRKQHEHATPVVGGLAVGVAFFLVAGVSGLFGTMHPAFWLAGALLLTVGVLDDMHEFASRPKFVVQIAAVLMMGLWGNNSLAHLGDLVGGGRVELGWAAVPFTVLGVVGVINAMNMIDGIDGLSGSLAFNALLGFAFIAWLAGNSAPIGVLCVLAGCLVAFLGYNLRTPWRARAAVFMGDAGTLFVGFVLAWFAVSFASSAGTGMRPVLALWLLAIPLFDAVTVMVRRIRDGKSPFVGDREHLHHLLLRNGLTVGQTVALIGSVAAALAGIGIAGSHWLRLPDHVFFIGFLVLFAAYVLWVERAWSRLRRPGR